MVSGLLANLRLPRGLRGAAAVLALLAVAVVAATGGELALAPTAQALIPTCSGSTAAVTPMHRPGSDPTTMRPFYSATDGVNDSGYAGWELNGPGLGSDTWVRLSGFAGGSLGLASHQSASIPARTLSTGGHPLVYAYLTAPSATATAQTFTVEVWNGKPDQPGSTELCTYADGFSSVIKTISANPNKITSISISNGSPAIGGSFTITAQGSTGTMGAGDSSDRVGGNGPFSMAPAMADSWPADAFTLTDVALTLQGATTHNVLRVYPTVSSDSAYTAVYSFTVRGTTSGATSVLPVQNIASGTQVKYTGSFPSTVSQIGAPSITTTVTKTVSSFATGVATYQVTVANSSSGATTLDALQDTPTPTSGWTLVAGSAKLGGSTIADPSVSSDRSTLYFAGPFTVPAASGGTAGTLTITYKLQLSSAVSNSVVATVGGQSLGAAGGGGGNAVSVDPAAPVITTASPAGGTVGSAYSQTFAATNGTAPYTWAVASGSLPAGLALSSAGVLSGTPTASGTSTFSVRVTDASSKTDTVSFSITVASGATDTTAPQSPSVTIAGGASVTTATSVSLGLSATDDTGVVAYRVAAGSDCSAASWVSVTSTTSYSGSASFTLATGDGTKTVCAQFEDAAGNVSTTATASIVLDTPPTVALSSSAADPTNGPFTVVATFSKSVTGFVAGDATVGNGSVSGFSGSGTTYSFTVTPTVDGTVSVDVAAGVASDAQSVANTAATQLTRGYGTTRPSVTLSSSSASTTNRAFTVTATFGESVTGFVAGDVTVANGSVSGFSGSGSSYGFTVTPTSDGAVTVDVAAGVATGTYGTNTASNQLRRTFDQTAPTVALTSASAATVSGAFSVTATFSESVTGFGAGGVAVTNGTVSGVSGSGDAYTFTVTPSAVGAVGVTVSAGAASDAAGNANTASRTLDRAYAVATRAPAVEPTPTPPPTPTTTTPAPTPPPSGKIAPQIEIAMSASTQQVKAGDTFTTTVTATNVGNGTANDVALHINLPASTEFVSGTAQLVNPTRIAVARTDASWPCQLAAGTIVCPVGQMTPDAKYVVNLNLRATQPGTMTVAADTTASNAKARHAQVDVNATPAHVTIAVRVDASTASVVIANSGGRSAEAIRFTAEPTGGAAIAAIAAGGAHCTTTAVGATCSVATLGAHRRLVVALHVRGTGGSLRVTGSTSTQRRIPVTLTLARPAGFSTIVHFASGSWALSSTARGILDRAAGRIRAGGLSQVVLDCNTDNVGSFGYNVGLSINRCAAVSGYLRHALHARPVAFKLRSFAYLRPAAPNSAPAGKAKNRRVEIHVT